MTGLCGRLFVGGCLFWCNWLVGWSVLLLYVVNEFGWLVGWSVGLSLFWCGWLVGWLVWLMSLVG